jgi:hypothetical protein
MLPGDDHKALRYFEQTESIIWTPKVSRGNPLILPIIPNLIAIRKNIEASFLDNNALDDENEELRSKQALEAKIADAVEFGVSQAVEALQSIPDLKFMKDIKKKALITFLIRYMSDYNREEPLTLKDLIDLLEDVPFEASDELGDHVTKIGPAMAVELKAAATINPDLKDAGTTDIAGLFRSPSGKPRVSIINLMGISSIEEKQIYVQKLIMNIFAWITRNSGKGLTGLLAIDEAREFVPSNSGPPSKNAIQRFANMSRKFGYGLIVASQAIKSVDNNTITNCNNLIFGKQTSSTNIETCKKMNLNGVDKLETGHFLGKSPSFEDFHVNPVNFTAAMCLSWHPQPPPSHEEIIAMAQRDRLKLSTDSIIS